MQIKPIKKRFFIRLNLIWILVFLAAFVMILYSVNPLEASTLTLIIFYIVLFCLVVGFLSLAKLVIKIPYWLIILIAICLIFILLILQNGNQ